ncbi:uncharacterized protein BDW43DRAFT_317414 [Aspergillus alliaceus]|uniref:uncharacterized protein n=1 Tax=Petromyces alliaceus TaxID=209559 RepID=UPI0012A3FB91|nr:uncharacterized protein BDW43DRAFT_317414 [Aspergillus alliaceus]KAB8226829.1 hypothetical protein BDW43DRAFT_317414 [Aspergillus alliaceus]
MKYADAVQIYDTVQQWEGIAQQANTVMIPYHMDQTQYLQDIAFQDILNSVDLPDSESIDPIEQGIRRLWDTMEQMVYKSQQTVDHSGQAIYIEAVQSETRQTLYQPL